MKGFLQNVIRERMNEHEKAMSTLTPKEMTTLSKQRVGRSGKRVDEATENSIKALRAKDPAATIVHIAKAHGVSTYCIRRVLGLLKVDEPSQQ